MSYENVTFRSIIIKKDKLLNLTNTFYMIKSLELNLKFGINLIFQFFSVFKQNIKAKFQY
ncbi:hypothetical protein BpHYR1_045746 [Brachionus plicatilis]|uniref:Uncharacterized protein n=1 Tax=Brachionus plicatilis TaxID=10195 RepID=A0A3M7Q5L5_BRAPC|nr:hypothetical protein BpHYR1_045746 [Brachionus plicatilis]